MAPSLILYTPTARVWFEEITSHASSKRNFLARGTSEVPKPDSFRMRRELNYSLQTVNGFAPRSGPQFSGTRHWFRRVHEWARAGLRPASASGYSHRASAPQPLQWSPARPALAASRGLH